jgi:polysaccharide biosynthesis protein PslG
MRSAIAAAGAAAMMLALAPATSAGAEEFIGVNQGQPLDQSDIQKIASTGVRTYRFMLGWASIEPTKGSFKWNPIDRLVGTGAALGIRSVPFAWATPPWVAHKSLADPPIDNASDRRAWRHFLEVAVDRYGPGGAYWSGPYQADHPGAKPLPIHAWQIWTEPNGKAYFKPHPSVKRYATLLRVAHDAIKRADPKAKVVLSGLVGLRKWRGRRLKGVPGWKFLRRLYEVPGAKHSFEIAAVHPYAPNLDQLRKAMKLTRAAMKKGHDKRTPLWITELGWGSAPAGSGNSLLELNKGIEGQRRMLAGSFKMIRRHRSQWRVRRLFWYDWRDPAKGAPAPCSFCESSGLLRHNHEPKPSYSAFRNSVRSSSGRR